MKTTSSLVGATRSWNTPRYPGAFTLTISSSLGASSQRKRPSGSVQRNVPRPRWPRQTSGSMYAPATRFAVAIDHAALENARPPQFDLDLRDRRGDRHLQVSRGVSLGHRDEEPRARLDLSCSEMPSGIRRDREGIVVREHRAFVISGEHAGPGDRLTIGVDHAALDRNAFLHDRHGLARAQVGDLGNDLLLPIVATAEKVEVDDSEAEEFSVRFGSAEVCHLPSGPATARRS